jgi:hypothetical protein
MISKLSGHLTSSVELCPQIGVVSNGALSQPIFKDFLVAERDGRKSKAHALVRQRINYFTVRDEFASLVSDSQADCCSWRKGSRRPHKAPKATQLCGSSQEA